MNFIGEFAVLPCSFFFLFLLLFFIFFFFVFAFCFVFCLFVAKVVYCGKDNTVTLGVSVHRHVKWDIRTYVVRFQNKQNRTMHEMYVKPSSKQCKYDSLNQLMMPAGYGTVQ